MFLTLSIVLNRVWVYDNKGKELIYARYLETNKNILGNAILRLNLISHFIERSVASLQKKTVYFFESTHIALLLNSNTFHGVNNKLTTEA